MKLRTEMLELGGKMRLATFVGCGDNRDPATAKEHDTMAAHALLQATKGVESDYADRNEIVDACAVIRLRADELGEEVKP